MKPYLLIPRSMFSPVYHAASCLTVTEDSFSSPRAHPQPRQTSHTQGTGPVLPAVRQEPPPLQFSRPDDRMSGAGAPCLRSLPLSHPEACVGEDPEGCPPASVCSPATFLVDLTSVGLPNLCDLTTLCTGLLRHSPVWLLLRLALRTLVLLIYDGHVALFLV